MSLLNCVECGTADPQYVKIRGTLGETTEQERDASFERVGRDVTCTIRSEEYIGDYRCVIWRHGGDNDWTFTQVTLGCTSELSKRLTKQICNKIGVREP